jgi:hypothetical protein
MKENIQECLDFEINQTIDRIREISCLTKSDLFKIVDVFDWNYDLTLEILQAIEHIMIRRGCTL